MTKTISTRNINSIIYKPEAIICRNFSDYDVDYINTELLNAKWDQLYNYQRTDSYCKCFEKFYSAHLIIVPLSFQKQLKRNNHHG